MILWAVIGSKQVVAQSLRAHSINGDEAGAPRIIVPLRIYRGFLPVAEGQIGGAPGQQNFVVDTGVAPSLINARLSAELGLGTADSTMAAVGKTIPTRMASLPELTLGPIQVNSLRVQVQDLSGLEHDLGIPVAAILGMDVLSRSSFRLDYRDKRIEFGEVTGEGIPVAFESELGVVGAIARLDGKTVRLIVDTGSEQVVLFGRNLTRREKFVLQSASSRGSTLGDGQLRVQEFAAPDLVIGTQYFAIKKAYLLPDSADPVFDGLLSIRALGCRAIEYDRVRRQVYLEK